MGELEKFYVCNGAALSTLSDLLGQLREMDDGTFSHHVGSKKNDFSSWVGSCLGDLIIAKKMLKTKKKEAMIKLLEKKVGLSGDKKKKDEVLTKIKRAISNG